MLTCKNATRLISESEDRPLSINEKMQLRLHLMLCSGCARYEKQIQMIGRACKSLIKGLNNRTDG